MILAAADVAVAVSVSFGTVAQPVRSINAMRGTMRLRKAWPAAPRAVSAMRMMSAAVKPITTKSYATL